MDTDVGVEPYLDGLRGETTVALAHDKAAAGLEDALNLLEDLERLVQIVNAHHARHDIERVIRERKLRIFVQILDYVFAELLVLLQLKLVHTQADPLTHSCWEILNKTADETLQHTNIQVD